MTGWTLADMPPQAGRSAVVTGTGGLGFETALALASKGAEVVLAGRNAIKGADAVSAIKRAAPGSAVVFEALDLASLASVAAFAERLAERRQGLDVLVNNAGVMAPPTRQTTLDGFELQFGVNYLGHFALTGRLLPLLRQGDRPRVVNLSSGAHHTGQIRFDDLQWTQSYSPWFAYSQSKLAMLMFAFELQRQSDAHGWGLMSTAAHPGYARTELIDNGPGRGGLQGLMARLLEPIASQTAAEGALPTLYALSSPDAAGGGYYGPDRMMELKGAPRPARISRRAADAAVAQRLWAVSQTLTGDPFPA